VREVAQLAARHRAGRESRRACPQQPVMQSLKAGVLYFSIVFATGFVLGTIRTLWILPSVGVRLAELMEMPVMLVVTITAARWAVRRLGLSPTPGMRLSIGFVARLIARCRINSRIVAAALNKWGVPREPRPGSRNSVSRNAWCIYRDAAPRGPKFR
jgi:hypothetical protein